MTQVRGRFKVCRGERCVEPTALFDTGSSLTYISERVAEKIGFNLYPEPKTVPLAVLDKEAEVIGDLTVSLEIDGCPMPRRETLEVIRNLRFEAIVGLDIIEKYDVVLDTKNGRVRLKKYPPEVVLI